MAKGASAVKAVREIRRKTRGRFSAEEKVRIVLDAVGIQRDLRVQMRGLRIS